MIPLSAQPRWLSETPAPLTVAALNPAAATMRALNPS